MDKIPRDGPYQRPSITHIANLDVLDISSVFSCFFSVDIPQKKSEYLKWLWKMDEEVSP
jgi:hypothetical protein